ncbi:MAG: DUF1573 domain-containing protein [Spartobacteria bacterium]|nr:DUF1573 domain-containing protein [Spartobacteria bacterium]
MSKVGYLIVLGTLVGAYAVGAQEVTQGFAPKIVCEEAVYNFGEADDSASIEHTFILKNEGNAVLEITRVRPACGCTVAELSEKLVEPGKQAELATTLSLKGRRGHQRKSITIECSDPENPRFMLYLEGNVARPLEINPDRLFFGQIEPETADAKTITLTSKSAPLTITEVSSSIAQFVPRLEVVEANKAYIIHVAAKPPLPEGHLNGFVRIARDGGQPDINIPVSAVVAGPLAVAPREIMMRAQGDPVTRYVVIRPGSVKEFEIEGLDVPHPDIGVNITPVGPGYRIELSNIVPDPALDGMNIKIRTNVAEKPEILIPFRIAE